MKKLFSLFAALLVAISMWGAAATVYTSNVTLSSSTKDGTTSADKATNATATISGTNYTAMKLGANKSSGYFYIEVPATTATLTLHAAGWNGKSNTLTLSTTATGVSISPSTAQTLQANSGVSGSGSTFTITPDNEYEYFTYTITGISAKTTIKLACSERCLIWGVNAESGVEVPTVAVSPASWNFNNVELNDLYAEGKDFAITGTNLTEALTASLKHEDHFIYTFKSGSLTPTSKTATAVVTITPFPDVVGTLYDTLVISGGGLTSDSLVPVQMTVFEPIPVAGVALNKNAISLIEGLSEKLKATISPNDATHKDVTWESDNELIATVDESGVVTAVKAGSTTITCKSVADPTKSATCAVTVTEPVEEKYVAIALSNITADKKIMITMSKAGNIYAIPSNKGTASSPNAVSVTLKNDTITVLNNKCIFWNIEKDEENYTIYVDGTTEKWLYSTDSNSGVRVGTNSNKTWCIESNYLKHIGTSRYMGVYTGTDWRAYTSINDNISGQTLVFYEKFNGSSTSLETLESSVKSVKFIQNGQLFIEQNGHIYNVMGQLVK